MKVRTAKSLRTWQGYWIVHTNYYSTEGTTPHSQRKPPIALHLFNSYATQRSSHNPVHTSALT